MQHPFVTVVCDPMPLAAAPYRRQVRLAAQRAPREDAVRRAVIRQTVLRTRER